jgi:hypothetical protein
VGRSARVVSGLRSRDRVLIRPPECGSRTRSFRPALLVAALREVLASVKHRTKEPAVPLREVVSSGKHRAKEAAVPPRDYVKSAKG